MRTDVQTRAETVPRTRHWGGPVVGGFYLTMAGVHLGIVAADPETYRGFADGAQLGVVREGWQDVFMANPRVWGLLLMAGELTLGVLLLLGGRLAAVGWGGVIGFHLLLMLFGFGIWAWAVPAIAVLVVLARKDLRRVTPD